MITAHPMANVKPPSVPEAPVAVLDSGQLKRLLSTVAGEDFVSRRDSAILRLFMDTGMRRGELANLRIDDVDLDQCVAYVVGKGNRPRQCPFGACTDQSIDRHLRQRNGRGPDANIPWLWLGRKGRLSDSGIL